MRLALALVLLALAVPASGQTQQVLFPDLEGTELQAAVDRDYSPATIRGDNDDLYARIDSTTVDGQRGVVGVYTGLFVPFDDVPSSDPSQDVFNNESGINQEHTWPNSLLSGAAEDDLHNLFPTQVGVNRDRGILPFADIPDDQATRWYRGAPPYTQTTVPTDEVDSYSEIRDGVAFEPREEHKGNVARALFYMTTVHDAQTNATFSFNEVQQRTLYGWHYADPVDQAELDRTYRIAAFQSDTPNPFVLDSTLIRRAYFPDIVVATEAGAGALALDVVGPNPFRDAGRLTLALPAPAVVRAEAYDVQGRRVAVLHDGPAPAGSLALTLDGAALAPGVYLVRVTADDATASRILVRTR